jgi:hypothetical protein
MQMDPIIRSRRKALREAQSWLLALAREMNDPHARQVLNTAAFAWGAEKLRGFNPTTGRSGYQERRREEARRAKGKLSDAERG